MGRIQCGNKYKQNLIDIVAVGGLIRNLGLFPAVKKVINNEDIVINRVRTDNTADSYIGWNGFTFNIVVPIGYILVNGKRVLTEQ